jgi:NADH-quinone oxidoreductase subunit H
MMLGGWASGSKYSFLGAMRAAAQLISYEVAQGLALLGVLMTAGTLSLTEIVSAQEGMWYIVPQFIGFIVFLVAASRRPTARRSTCPRPTPSSCRAT